MAKRRGTEFCHWGSMGTFIVDGDNDGKDDLFAWNIQGSGRFVYAELFDIRSIQDARKLASKAAVELGVLQDPRFIRFKGINYLVSTETGDEGRQIGAGQGRLQRARFAKDAEGFAERG